MVAQHSAAMHFVKSGGTLLEFRNRERHRLLRAGRAARPWRCKAEPAGRGHARQASRDHGVPGGRTVPVCRSASYPTCRSAPAVPPLIRGFSPHAGRSGEIVTLTGKGFARHECSAVPGPDRRLARGRFPRGLGPRAPGGGSGAGDHDEPAAPGCRDQRGSGRHGPAESDHSVRPPLPRIAVERRIKPQTLYAQASCGSIPARWSIRYRANRFSFPRADSSRRPTRTTITSSSTTAGWENLGGDPSSVFFEPNAILPDRLKRAPIGEMVRVIVPSPVSEAFLILGTRRAG